MKKKVFSLMMTLVLAFMGVARAEVVTIGNGTSTTYVTPFNSLWGYSFVEQIYTASEIGTAGTINSISFNLSSGSQTNQIEVFMKNVSRSAFSGSTDYEPVSASDMVFSGTVTFNAGWTTITLDTPFAYDGTSNLLVGMHEYTAGYSTLYFNYTTATDMVLSYHSDGANPDPYNLGSYSGNKYTSPNRANIQIDITPGGAGNGDQLHVQYMDGENVVIDSLNLGVRPINAWTEPFAFTMYSEGPNYTVTVLDFTPSDGMFTAQGEELPFQVARNNDVDLTIGINATVEGLIERQFVAITEGDRAAHVWPIVVEMYTPAMPDVVEMPKEFTVTDGFSHVGVPATYTPTELHNDYDLPFDEIPEGYDAVYKLTFANDAMLNAYVSAGDNGKVALYREDFNGEGGPMAENYYTGPSANGGGATGGSFEAMIGDETSTTTSTYFPFHTLWNYSIGENLFLASELTEAGVTTAPMTSLSWYVSSTTCTTPQNGISIWMANVSDSELTATSHTTAGMSLVYTGTNVLPVAGEWNEFVFNAGNFAWDGHSNVLVVCQRLNGDWQGSVSWQTHNPGFTAMTYDYDDYEVYDMTSQTYSMYTSATNRANIIFKGNSRASVNNFTYNFEAGVAGWTDIDNDGDGHTWFHSSYSLNECGYDYTDLGHNASDGFMASASYNDMTGDYYDADNYLVSPQKYTLGDNASVNFFFDRASDNYPDYFEVCVATADNPGASDFTSIWNSFMRSNAEKAQIRHTNNRYENWREITVDLSAYAGQDVWIAFHHHDIDYLEVWIDDVTINTGSAEPTPGPEPEPLPLGEMAYGPEIINAAVEAGTYYLVASSTTPGFEVTINAEDMPCPAVDAEGFVLGETPADNADEIEPGSVTLRWNIPAYATGWRLVFGSTYYPDPNHPQTIMYPEDGSFATELANSYTVRNLWNNTHYFWRVEFNNGACEEGVSSPVWGFTTHLNIPTNLTAVDYTVFDDEQIVLNWNAVVDRTYRFYNVYRDGELIGNTQVNNISNTTYTDGPLEYNMEGYTYYVTAVYDEGESAPSDPVTVKVSGYGDVNGHVYEQDGTTGIAGATVTMVGLDEFNVSHTYTFQTNAQGYYSGHIYAGVYNGSASCNGYQTIDAPVQGNPINMVYNQTTSPIDYMLDENFDPVCGVIAEYYPDSLDPNSPYVKVYWGCGLPGSEIIEPFETGDFSMFDWQVDPTYPWSITTTNPYEGTYCMKSGGAGVANVVSNMTVTVNIPADGIMSFFGKISCESSWDYGYFYIDGVQKGSYTGAGNWAEKVFDITAGDHTFQWRYTKDGSVNSNDDCFYVDYITFYRQPEPAIPGMTYTFDDATMQGWTSVDADGDGYGWMVGSELMTGQAGHNGSADFVFSQSYNNNVGVLYPDNYLVSPQVQLGGVVRFYACAQDASYAAEHFGLAVSTTNTQPSSFTTVQEWTMSAKSVAAPAGKAVKNSRSGREQGNWYEYTVDLSAYSGMGYVAIRHFNCSDMFYLDVDDITIGEPGKGIAETRRLSHYNVYRTNCYNDGPYTEENTVFLATVWVPDTVYMDVEWADLPAGVYKWGVGTVYVGNRGEEIESEISWTEPINVNNAEATRATLTFDFDDSSLQGWTTIDGGSPAGYGWHMGSTTLGTGYGHNASTDLVISQSYDNNYGIVYPDNYLISPQVALGGSISFYACAQDANYAAEHFGVAVSTSGTNASDFSMVQEWTIGAKNGGAKDAIRGTRDQSTWTLYTVDLSAYAGQTGYVAIRHFNCSDQYFLDVDDITIVEGAGGPTPPTPPTPGAHGLAEPRQSEIVWSNCLDKDMYLDHVSVNVLMNSADSPEGTEVTFTNLNEYEQQTYGGYNVTLDGSGYYLWDSFRKGEYAVKVAHVGYETINDTVSIWETTDLRYVMIEIIYGVENVYVSRTGWAMWDPLDPQAGGSGINPTPGPGGDATTFNVGFEEGMPEGWTRIDANNDGNRWEMTSDIPTAWPYYASLTLDWYRTGTNAICSGSYINGVGAITPDDYLVTPQVTLAAGSTFSFWAAATDANYPAEHFGVFVSDDATNWTSVQEWTLTAKGGSKAGDLRASRDGNGNRLGNWHQYSVDLSAFAGQKYIAIRHFNCNDQYIMCVDDIELTAGAKNGGDRHLEYYKVMCTSIDGVPIFNHNTVWPFCQLSTNEPYNAPLVEGEHYLCKVAVMYSTGMSAWSEPVEWVYEPCDHWGPVDAVEMNTTGEGNHIEWVFEHGFNPYANDTVEPGPQPGTGDWYYYDNGVNVDAIGTGGGNFYWGVMFPAGSYTGNTVTKVSAYDYMAMTGNVTIYTGGTNAPGTAVGQTNVTFTGSEDFVEFEFASPVAIDPSQNVWVVFYNGSGATYPAAVCDNTGDANGRWVSIDGTDWMDLVSAGLDNTFMVRAYIASGRGTAQQVNVYGNGDGGTLAVSGNGPRVKNAESMDFVMTSENTAEFNIGNMANYDGRVYFLHKLVNDSRFSVINAEQGGVFIVSANGNINLKDSFADFVEQTTNDFARMDKYAAADYASQYKGTLPMAFVNSMMNDLYVRSRENNMCEFADPFCTDNGMYEFPAGVNAGSGEAGPDYDCLYTQPNPAWYYMRIGDPGAMDIHMYSTPEVDIDFCCWGPFEDPTTPCPNGLTEDKVVSCSYSTSWTEHCMIPATAQTGEYYILVITNYSNQPCNINFSMVAGAGSTDCGILPPTDIIGFLITMDGEYLAFAEPTDRDFMHEGEFGDHEYCVRPIYPGEMTLPDHNYGWSMGCPVCAGDIQGCAAYMPIHGEAMEATDQVKVWWGDENPGPGPGGCEGDEFSINFDNSQMPAGWTTHDEDGDGYNWVLGTGCDGIYLNGGNLGGAGHNASADLICSGSYSNVVGPLTPDNWLISPTLTLCEGSVFSFWACGQDAGYVAEHFGVAVSEDNGNSFAMVQEWTMTAKSGGDVMSIGRNGNTRAQGTWHQYTVDLSAYAGEGRKIALRHFNCTDQFILDVDDLELTNGAKRRADIVSFNVYRSTDNDNYAIIGTVPYVDGQTYYEYIDTPETAGTYFYQVTTVYANECESEPAMSFDDPSIDYVEVGVTGLDENSDGVALYPNPTNGNVTIEAAGMSRITVVSVLGQVVYDVELKADTYTMNMGQFNAGMYMVRVYTENGMVVKRVTVMQ